MQRHNNIRTHRWSSTAVKCIFLYIPSTGRPHPLLFPSHRVINAVLLFLLPSKTFCSHPKAQPQTEKEIEKNAFTNANALTTKKET
jgi:hypothetical protein